MSETWLHLWVYCIFTFAGTKFCLCNLTLLDFLRDVGKYAKVNVMISRDSVKSRLESSQGISFTEFSYQLLQAYDYFHLYTNYGCRLQIGGADQWGNIIAGIDLIKRRYTPQEGEGEQSEPAYGLTIPLLTTPSGEKFGKSAGNAVWLDSNMTPVLDFYQYFVRQPDESVDRLLRIFTFIPLAQIKEIISKHQEDPGKRYAQRTLAYEATSLVHGETLAHQAQAASRVLYESDIQSASLSIFEDALKGDRRLMVLPSNKILTTPIANILVEGGLVKSKGQVDTLAKQGGLQLNGSKESNPRRVLRPDDFVNGEVVVDRLPAMSGTKNDPRPIEGIDVFIAGSGPIGCTFARKILDNSKKSDLKVWMVDVGSQDNPVIGRHHKNSIKYQKDIDAFVNVIKGALQTVSVPPADTYMATLGAEAWSPGEKQLVSAFYNPKQKPSFNLPGCAITRTIGGMATHWTCACPVPHREERKNSPLPQDELLKLIEEAGTLLNVNLNEYDDSVRHTLVREILKKEYPGQIENHDVVTNLPLAVKRNKKNPAYVTWSGSDTVLGKYSGRNEEDEESEISMNYQKDPRFTLQPEHKLIGFVREGSPTMPGDSPKVDYDRLRDGTGDIKLAYVKDVKHNEYLLIPAKYFVVACGAIGTPQVLWNSGFGIHDEKPTETPELPALGHYLTEQSISFCQVVLKREFIDKIDESPYLTDKLKAKCKEHHQNFGDDPIRIPFADPEPQVTMPYTAETPWHTQIHRDAFSYGDVGPRADPRLIVDLRFFGKQEAKESNFVTFSDKHTDIYGMPQATFNVTRSTQDSRDDQRMMLKMCEVAGKLGPFLPGSYPQFMAPGLALHITGTTRLGVNKEDSVANEFSQVHGHKNLFVGGNGVIPDSTACNPTRTSVAYAIKSSNHIASLLSA
ncbi:hypothetical protein BN14_01208 [Rhizoctonia solani AG-1 IB]|uniref:Tyrosine--tRNA ligase n=2 Tax=Thanatephorus cucumeris (strain AG1-IB / isolate 7/3/14) TaxID=1108050 RepID=M5BIZ9_THACB|nr:hypothetical protein BN14_01208 [Rhizoctonia solani AG-1 IB]